VRRGGFWAKHIGLNSSAIGTSLGDTLKTWGTTWKNGKNTSATQKKKKKNLSPLTPTTQIKMLGP